MEVSGQVAFPIKHKQNLYCIPCNRDAVKESAHGYCQTCQEHLCKTCFQHHKRARPSRDHILLDKDTMPQQQTTDDQKPDDITDICTSHRDKLLEFYCNTHKSVACYVCVTLGHKQCNVDYIPGVSENVSDEFKDLVTKMEVLVKKCESNIRKAQSARRNLDQTQEKVIKEIRLFRKEIDARLDDTESRIVQESKALFNTAKYKLKNVKDTCLEIAEELKSSHSLLKSLEEENKKNKQFIEMKNLEPRLMTLTDKEKQTVEDNKTDEGIEFVRNAKMFDQLNLEKSFGMIYSGNKPSEDRTISFKYNKTIDLKSRLDKKKCDAHGMVLTSTSKMIVADYGNKTIKMIDVHEGSLVSEMTLSSEPQDVIILPHNKLAVALPIAKYIQIMSYTDRDLLIDRRIDVREKCYCVAYCQGKLVVGCNHDPGKLVIIDLDGNIVQQFDTQGLFAGPENIIISSDERFLYISDFSYNIGRCIKMNWQGNVVQQFEQTGYKRPIGIQELEDGTLLVCYRNSDKIVRLSSSFKLCKVEGLEKADLSHRPWALAYSEKDKKIYVSCGPQGDANDVINVFNIKWV